MFDLKTFNKAKFEPKVESIRLDALSAFFAEGSDPIFKVRGLSHSEFFSARESQEKDKALETVLRAVAGDTSHMKDAIDAIVGVNESLNEKTRQRIEIVVSGSVEPKLDKLTARKLSDNFPMEFEALSKTILELTDQPAVVAKKKQ